MQYSDLQHQLTGQWPEILAMYGIEVPRMQGLNSKNAACPLCGGDDRAHWREVDGRLALFCRHCTDGSMKSPEDVIQEACSMDFKQLYSELLAFSGNQPPEKVKQAKRKFNAQPKRNVPVSHKQDHEKSEAFLAGCDTQASHYIFNRFGVQYPYDVRCKSNAVFFDVRNEAGVIVNVFAVFDKNGTIETSHLAGGVSSGAWHKISACETRAPQGVVYTTSIIEGIKQWWLSGREVRVVLDIYNMNWMLIAGVVELGEHDEFVGSPKEIEFLAGNL